MRELDWTEFLGLTVPGEAFEVGLSGERGLSGLMGLVVVSDKGLNGLVGLTVAGVPDCELVGEVADLGLDRATLGSAPSVSVFLGLGVEGDLALRFVAGFPARALQGKGRR